MEKKPLRIGYLWQSKKFDASKISASILHIKAVVQGFQRRNHQVRMVSLPQGKHQWSEDLMTWQAADLGRSQTRPFRVVESITRGVQSRLRAPYINLFESYRFSEACLSVLSNPDILYERYWLNNYGGVIAAKRLGIPLVFELNGDPLREFAEVGLEFSKTQWALSRLIMRLMFNAVDHVVAVSEILRQRAIELWVHNGAHVELFDNEGDSLGVRNRYGLGDGPLVIFVGGFKPWHGLDLLIDAFRELTCSGINSDTKLVLVGDGQLRPEMENRVDALQIRDHVIFAGRVSHQEVVSLLGTAQIAVMSHSGSPTTAARSPMKLFEYMAAGKAIVAPTLPNVEKVLTHRLNGLLVPPDDPLELAKAFCELLKNSTLRANLGREARKKAVEEHSWDRTVSKIESILYAVLEK
jgi:glycosyltransferase involved in cell wall biosynthesis